MQYERAVAQQGDQTALREEAARRAALSNAQNVALNASMMPVVEARLQAVADLSSHAGVPAQFVSRSILLRRRPFSPQRESVFARQVPLTQLLQSKSLPDLGD